MQSPDGSAPSSPALSDNCENNSPEEYHNVIARSRWRILAQALQKCEVVPTMPSSVRRFQSYGLVSALPLENLHEDSATWYEYRATIGQDLFSVLIRHPKRTFTATDLMGFNNTGNICVWPSEEVLAYYSLCNPNTFSNKSVLELGGGMSCLAGLMIGKYTSASKVLLTDGNVFSINNVHHILVKNGFGNSSRVSSSVLKWGKRANSKVEFLTEELQSKPASLKFDVIICADCLFFDDARQDLVQTIFDFIADDGIALLTAPRRADTLDKFYDKACNAGFICNLQEIYNDQIWDRHLHLKANHGESYNENIHYPLLLQLKKMSFYNSHQVDKSESDAGAGICSFPFVCGQTLNEQMADVWRSQPRKQCDFCKCWIADNKPSIAFHESGKKHKENVAKRLSEISKKSAKDAKQQLQMDKEIQKMEEAALRAYMKDIQGSGDFTSQLVLEGLEQKQRAADEAAEKQAEAKQAREAAKAREKIDLELKRKRVKEKAKATKWHEARSDEGYSYYWHVDTNETKWEPPADGYISIADQKVLEEAEKAKAEVNVPGKKGKGKHFSGGKKRKPEDSGAPPSATKKMVPEAKAAASSSKAEKLPKNIPTMGPAPKPNPYGLWKSIEKKVEVEPVDLELPSQQQAEIKVPALVDDRPKIKFHEKKISRPIVDDDASTSQPTFTGFKKKGNFRGNTRQRLDTDD